MRDMVLSIISLSLVCVALIVFLVCLVTKKKVRNKYFLGIVFLAALILQFGAYYRVYSSTPALLCFLTVIEAISMITVHISDELIAFAQIGILPQIACIFGYCVVAIATISTLVDLLGRNLMNRIKLWHVVKTNHDVVIGNSELSEIFIKSINKDRAVIVLNEINDAKYRELLHDGYVVINEKFNNDILKKIVGKNNNIVTNVAVLCADDDDNYIISQLFSDYVHSIMKIEKNGKQATKVIKDCNLFVYVDYSKMDRLNKIEFLDESYGKVEFFNKYDIRARKLFMKYPITKLIPADWIDTSKARLKESKKIGNLFVGFGENNKQVLYKNIANNYLLGCDFAALIYSKASDYDDTLSFQKQIRPILYQTDRDGYLPLPKEIFKINFEKGDIFSDNFENEILTFINDNDYTSIYIALGDDKLVNECCNDIELLLKRHAVYDKTKIFAKIKNEQTLRGNKTVLALDENTCFYGDLSNDITREDIFNRSIDDLAKKINGCYDKSKNGSSLAEVKWQLLGDTKRDSNRYAALSIPVKLNLMGLEILKTVPNNYEKITAEKYDKILYEEYLNRDKIENSSIDGNGDYASDCVRNNLAELEHARWNAFHFSRGWMQMPKEDIAKLKGYDTKNEALKQHACITTFEGLREFRNIKIANDSNAKNKATKDLSKEEIKLQESADVIKYDYLLMDMLYELLDGTGYNICIKK